MKYKGSDKEWKEISKFNKMGNVNVMYHLGAFA